MKTRQEYVQGLKDRLDAWNADLAKWEAQAESARDDLRARYRKDIEAVRARREEARYQLRLLQAASATAWTELTGGADAAWDGLQAAVAQASTHFERARKK